MRGMVAAELMCAIRTTSPEAAHVAVGLLPETESDAHDPAVLPGWLCWAAIALVPLAYIASESGWLVAEFGRQPWTIQDMLPTWASVSDLHSSSVIITFFLFLFLFTTMLAVEINILLKQIKKGPGGVN